ncbi:MAG: divalent-cation tolerance protein CutA [Candidatus Binatus sp.]|uniref:divalent-cation tolerance protein CutA n=1 Tax=Candidatus Binatus sp. TaxID=2811406 RepID=UPI00271AF4A4|nr:divalent-cation tolerance protein CutA [Candidatus Binatus sp.]MDO8433895.1 divalent-cation tolerance protein CutA [Candidatus Binatus sp.]
MPTRTQRPLRAILVTASGEEQARSIARILVGERLAACVNIVGPIRSVYRWRDAVEDEPEYLLVIKTRAMLYGKVERRVRELHTYEVPEVLALKIERGSPPYVNWLLESTGPAVRTAAKSRKQTSKRSSTRAAGKTK